MSTFRVVAAAAAALVLSSSFTANAALLTQVLSFSASGFSPAAPQDPVSGSVTVTWDTSQSWQTVVPDAVSLTIVGHTYAVSEIEVTIHSLGYFIGGVLNGVAAVAPGTDDFEVQIEPWGDYVHAMYSTAGFEHVSLSFTGTASVRDVPTGVPEPATLALLGAGLLGLGTVRRTGGKRRIAA